MKRRSSLGSAALLAAWTVAAGIPATGGGHDWPGFRGPNRDGVSAETGLADRWPDGGPRQVWRMPLGEGYSGVSVVGDRLYTMYAGDDAGRPAEFAVALDAASGAQLWRTAIGAKHDTEFGNGPRATPTIDGDAVYVLGSLGDLVALAASDGTERWRVNLTEAFGAKQPHWGFSTSPLVDGPLLLVQTGGPEGKSLAALSKKTGAVKWTIGDSPALYNSTLPVDVGGKRRYVHVMGDHLLAVDANGREIWRHPWPKGESHAMPLFVPPDRIFASGTEGIGGALLRVKGDAVEPLWTTRFMRNHFSSSIFHEGHVYGFDNATLKSIRVEDAALAWAKRGLGKGSLILADARLIVLSDRGKLVLLDASPAGYTELGSVQALQGRCWTAPTLSHGRLYVRNHEEIVCYDVTG